MADSRTHSDHPLEPAIALALLHARGPSHAAAMLAGAAAEPPGLEGLTLRLLQCALTGPARGVIPGAYAWLAMRAEPLAQAVLAADMLAPALHARWRREADAGLGLAQAAADAGAFAFASLDGRVTLLRPAHRLAAVAGLRATELSRGLSEAARAISRALAVAHSPYCGRLSLTLSNGIIARAVAQPGGAPGVLFYSDRKPRDGKPNGDASPQLHAALAMLRILRAARP